MAASQELTQLISIINSLLPKDTGIINFLSRMEKEHCLYILRQDDKEILIPVRMILGYMDLQERERWQMSNIMNEIGKRTLEERIFGEFIEAVLNAIAKSQAVRDFIETLHQENRLDKLLEGQINLFPSKLIEEVFTPRNTLRRLHVTRTKNPPELPAQQQYIDGQLLSINEILFEEYCAEHFDTKEWLKKNRLMWPTENPPKGKKT